MVEPSPAGSDGLTDAERTALFARPTMDVDIPGLPPLRQPIEKSVSGSDALPEEIARILMLSNMTYGGRCQLEDAIRSWVTLQRAEAQREMLIKATTIVCPRCAVGEPITDTPLGPVHEESDGWKISASKHPEYCVAGALHRWRGALPQDQGEIMSNYKDLSEDDLRESFESLAQTIHDLREKIARLEKALTAVPCHPNDFISRVCERGTKGCIVYHQGR